MLKFGLALFGCSSYSTLFSFGFFDSPLQIMRVEFTHVGCRYEYWCVSEEVIHSTTVSGLVLEVGKTWTYSSKGLLLVSGKNAQKNNAFVKLQTWQANQHLLLEKRHEQRGNAYAKQNVPSIPDTLHRNPRRLSNKCIKRKTRHSRNTNALGTRVSIKNLRRNNPTQRSASRRKAEIVKPSRCDETPTSSVVLPCIRGRKLG